MECSNRLDELVVKYENTLFRAALAILGDVQEAEDAVRDELSHVELPGGTEHLVPVLIRPRSHHDPVVVCLQDGVICPKVGKDIDEGGIGGVDAGDGDEDEGEDSECRCQKLDVDFGFH